MSFPSPARDWWEVPLSLDEICDLKNPAVFLFRYEGEDIPFVKKGAVLVVDKSLTPKAGDLVLITTGDEMTIQRFDALRTKLHQNKEEQSEEEVATEGVVTRVLNVFR